MKELLNKKILIVDDEAELLTLVENALFHEGFYNVYTANCCKKAEVIGKEQSIALFLLDINLPDGNGFMLYKKLREFSKAPVIFLTARGEAQDRIQGLNLGADDYIVKPFLMKELVLRVRALLRRTYGLEKVLTGFALGDKYVDFEKAVIISSLLTPPDKKVQTEIPFTAKEFLLLKKLWENKNRIVTNDALCMTAWGEEYYGHENTLMVHIRRLREKIEPEPSSPKYLITMKGLGYKLVLSHE